MDIEVTQIAVEDKHILANLLELYLHDLSEFDGQEVGRDGRYGYAYMNDYWREADRHPYFIRANGRLAGFALVRVVPDGGARQAQMAEFFVLRKYRRQGVGETAARYLFDAFPGPWVVSELESNPEAQRFWRAVIKRYLGDGFVERHAEGRVIQAFEAARR